jgi:hypothetical protein
MAPVKCRQDWECSSAGASLKWPWLKLLKSMGMMG